MQVDINMEAQQMPGMPAQPANPMLKAANSQVASQFGSMGQQSMAPAPMPAPAPPQLQEFSQKPMAAPQPMPAPAPRPMAPMQPAPQPMPAEAVTSLLRAPAAQPSMGQPMPLGLPGAAPKQGGGKNYGPKMGYQPRPQPIMPPRDFR